MKKILLTAALVLAVFPALAQSQTAEEYMHGEVKKDATTRLITDFFKQNGIMLYGICRFLMGNKLDR